METPQGRSHVKGKFMDLETLAPPAGNLGKQLSQTWTDTLPVAFGSNHTPWYHFIMRVWRAGRCSACA